MNNWIEQLHSIIEEYAGGKEALQEEGLEGDQIENLCNIIKLKIRLFQGNMTQREYERAMDLPNHIDLNQCSESESDNFITNAFMGIFTGDVDKLNDALIGINAERYLMYDFDADCFWIKINIYNAKEVGVLQSFGVIDNVEAFKKLNYGFVMLIAKNDSELRIRHNLEI